jgi:hypothetical protein
MNTWTKPTEEQLIEWKQAEEERRKNAITTFQAARGAFVDHYMAKAGIARHELTAAWDQVPGPIKQVLPDSWCFGIVGGFGIGKTCAVSARLRRQADKAVDALMALMIEKADTSELKRCAEEGDLHRSPGFVWVNWPEAIAENRPKLFNCGGEVESWIMDDLLDAGRLVVLDDIGAEPVTAQDWAGQLLARVVDERLRRQGPTVWTSNLDAKGLVHRYGPRTWSRLQALAPLIQLPKQLPDLRLQPRRAAIGNIDQSEVS